MRSRNDIPLRPYRLATDTTRRRLARTRWSLAAWPSRARVSRSLRRARLSGLPLYFPVSSTCRAYSPASIFLARSTSSSAVSSFVVPIALRYIRTRSPELASCCRWLPRRGEVVRTSVSSMVSGILISTRLLLSRLGTENNDTVREVRPRVEEKPQATLTATRHGAIARSRRKRARLLELLTPARQEPEVLRTIPSRYLQGKPQPSSGPFSGRPDQSGGNKP